MIISVYLPLIAAALVGVALRSRRFLPGHPAVQTWAVSVVAIVTAFMSTWSLVLLATARIDRVAFLTERLHLVGGLLRRSEHVPLAVSISAAVYLIVRVLRMVRLLARSRQARRAATVFRSKHEGALVVVADENPIAFALAGNRHVSGTVVVGTALFTMVPVPQRRAVLAHEHAHLALRHHAHRGAVNIAVALEPFLASASTVSGRAIERWADEHANTGQLQRGNAADAIATFVRQRVTQNAGAERGVAVGLGGLAFAENDALARIEALRKPPPRRRIFHAVPVGMVVIAIVSATGDATQQLAHLVHAAIR